MATHDWPDCRHPVGWATKKDAAAVARQWAAGRVIRCNFGRLHGVQWVALDGVGERCEALTRDGQRVPVVVRWDGRRHSVNQPAAATTDAAT